MSDYVSAVENDARKRLLRQQVRPQTSRPVETDFPHEFTREEKDYYDKIIESWDYFRSDELADKLAWAKRRIEGTRLLKPDLSYQVPMVAAETLIARRLRRLQDSELKNIGTFFANTREVGRVDQGDKEFFRLINEENKRRGMQQLKFVDRPILVKPTGGPRDRIAHAFGDDGYSTFEYYNDGDVHVTYMGAFVDFTKVPARLQEAQAIFKNPKKLRQGPMYRSW